MICSSVNRFLFIVRLHFLDLHPVFRTIGSWKIPVMMAGPEREEDAFPRFSPAIEPRFTWRGSDVVDVLERIS
jgi:hypothetical protein